jgi:hypothetical protein
VGKKKQQARTVLVVAKKKAPAGIALHLAPSSRSVPGRPPSLPPPSGRLVLAIRSAGRGLRFRAAGKKKQQTRTDWFVVFGRRRPESPSTSLHPVARFRAVPRPCRRLPGGLSSLFARRAGGFDSVLWVKKSNKPEQVLVVAKKKAPAGIEPANKGFADLSLSHLGTAP